MEKKVGPRLRLASLRAHPRVLIWPWSRVNKSRHILFLGRALGVGREPAGGRAAAPHPAPLPEGEGVTPRPPVGKRARVVLAVAVRWWAGASDGGDRTGFRTCAGRPKRFPLPQGEGQGEGLPHAGSGAAFSGRAVSIRSAELGSE